MQPHLLHQPGQIGVAAADDDAHILERHVVGLGFALEARETVREEAREGDRLPIPGPKAWNRP